MTRRVANREHCTSGIIDYVAGSRGSAVPRGDARARDPERIAAIAFLFGAAAVSALLTTTRLIWATEAVAAMAPSRPWTSSRAYALKGCAEPVAICELATCF